ncbi:two-component regulator propeller domain-containing protein [Saccharicrinis sp. FJH62]|uniref:two-component regulator propeller domain-containing protein n=1 Tax=Saccharicrinis sp. FJH62 TaxID=3344657 RepID=UPI0035D4C4BF
MIITILVFGLDSALLSAQQITVREIPALDKLPVNAIHRIFQDSDGYMWFGTFNGLCRYDGYEVITIRSDFQHPDLLADNYITYINEDQNKNIWFGTLKGAYILSKENYKITPVDLGELSSQNVFSINVTHDGTIWISVSGKLLRFKSDGELINTYDISYDNAPRSVYFVYENTDGELLISITGGGMYRLDRQKDQFEPYFHNRNYMDIERIIRDKEHNCYWLGTWGRGIVRFTPDAENESQRYVPQPLPLDAMNQPVADLFHMVRDDEFGYLWVTTQKKLFAFRINEKGMLEQVDTSPFLDSDNKMLYEIYKDREGKLWVSAFDVKSFIIDIHEHKVKKYPLKGLRDRIRANPAIVALYYDKDSLFWLSQERYGLYMYDAKTEGLMHYSECESVRNLPFWYVQDMIGSKTENMIWAVTYGSEVYGLSHDRLNMELQVQIKLNDVSDNPGLVASVWEDKAGKLWIGTGTGLYVYHISGKQLEPYAEDLGHVADITETNDGTIWLAVQNKGICSIDSKLKLTWHPFKKDFVCIDATSDGNLWLGTGKGEVLKYSLKDNNLEDYSLACGMKGDIINNVVVDEYNHLWIVTNQNIKEYNPYNSAYRIYSTRNSDYLVTRFLSNAVFYNKPDEIFFGGISGVISISPSQQLEGIPEKVSTHITDIRISGKSIMMDYTNGKRNDELLNISPDEKNLEIDFSSLDFHHLDQIRYAYRMEGLEDEWVYPDIGINTAFYRNLKKGDYTFQVKSTDKNGLWSNQVTSLSIVRQPAWFESWIAYVIYLLLGLSALIYGVYIVARRTERRHKEKWADSAELVKMHQYVDSNESASTPEFVKIDKTMIDKATHIVESNLDDSSFNIESLANEMNMSRSTLSRKIKVITGKTAFEFIKEIKMVHARGMLENKTATITEVMAALGYSDYKNFTESFKSIYGISPGEYQKRSKS